MVSTDVLCWYFNRPPVPQAPHGCWGWKHPSPRYEGSVGTKPHWSTPPLGPGSFNLISSGPQTGPDPWHGVWELLPEPKRRTQRKVRGGVLQAFQNFSLPKGVWHYNVYSLYRKECLHNPVARWAVSTLYTDVGRIPIGYTLCRV